MAEIKSVYGVGITGGEKTVDENGETLKSYQCWRSMINRCYNDKIQQKHPTYIGCSVCEDWLYYSTFKKWYNENYYEISDRRIEIDKDILVKGNKIYSPDTCIFVPKDINLVFMGLNLSKGILPQGVCYDDYRNKYAALYYYSIGIGKRKKHLGLFDAPEEAFEAYKKFKEGRIKYFAEIYKLQIPEKLYNAMIDYSVDIND